MRRKSVHEIIASDPFTRDQLTVSILRTGSEERGKRNKSASVIIAAAPNRFLFIQIQTSKRSRSDTRPRRPILKPNDSHSSFKFIMEAVLL